MNFQYKSLFRNVALGVVALAASAAASATVLSSRVNMDNAFSAYLSTSDSTQGTQFSTGSDWTATIFGSTNLNAGTDYYLHISGQDQGGIAGFLGQFSLTGSDHVFSNNLTSLLTNTVNWKGNNSGFNGTYGALGDLGVDGVGPWGNRPSIDDNAHWIWAGDANNNNVAYFTTKISAVRQVQDVPEPESLALLGLGLAGLAALRRRKAK